MDASTDQGTTGDPSGGPVDVGDPSVPQAAPPTPVSNPQPGPNYRLFIGKLYRDLLQRTPSQSEVRYWVAELNAGVTRDHVAAAFASTAEYRGIVVEADYHNYLGRAPEAPAIVGRLVPSS